jgi:RNA polymerase sigma factor (sigma-70 family)
MTTDTQELLAKFVQNGSEPAFRELVARYVDLVYSAAVRLVDGDTHRAEDVAQIVFADLARMASKLSGSTTLGGWLHRHTCFVARTVMRGERRRQARERQAVEMNALNDQRDSVLAQIAPVLDEAIQELGADDRDAILLRFFEQRNLRSVGEALGTTENVAQKRVARAVQELGILLQRRGVALSAAALASGLAAGAVKAAPAGLALGIAGKVFAGAGAAGTAASASVKVAGVAKLKIGIVAAIVVAGAVTGIFLQSRSKASLHDESSPAQQQPVQVDAERTRGSDPASPEAVTPPPKNPPRAARTEAPQNAQPVGKVAAPPARQSAAIPQKTIAGNMALPYQRFAAISGSRVRIEGTSNIGDWQVESSAIGGSLDIAPGFPAQTGQALSPGPVPAQAEAHIAVHSLKSVETDGRAHSYDMDQIMFESLRERQYPMIYYRLGALALTAQTNNNGVPQYECESHGELAVAGITNELTMPVLVQSLGNGKLIISGAISLRMSSFQIDPPARTTALGTIRAGDDVRLLFEWVVYPTKTPAALTQNGWVPLVLDLPAPAFKGTPRDLKLGSNLEPLSDQPRPPMLVPPGLTNLAPGSHLSCSDANVSANSLAKITDGDKGASDQSIIFLRKGTQWVQMDFGKPQQLFALVIWHAHNMAKAYHDVIVQAADDSHFTENVRTLFNNDSDKSSGLGVGMDREYCESHEGKLINAHGIIARCLRFYSKASTESALNEYTEIEVYGRQAR